MGRDAEGCRGYAGEMAKTIEQMLAEAKAFGIEVTITAAPPKPTTEVVLLPGVRPPTALS